MLHYYLQKGIMPGSILSLSSIEQEFYMASMLLAIEEHAEQINAMTGR